MVIVLNLLLIITERCPTKEHNITSKKIRYKRKLLSSRISTNRDDLVGKFEKLLFSVRSEDKLSDEHISAASELLRAQFTHVQGLCTPVLGQRLCFPLFDEVMRYAGHSYIQVIQTTGLQ